MSDINSAAKSTESTLCKSYRFSGDVYNEMCSEPGSLRKHWEYLAKSLDSLGTAELRRRYGEARRLIRDNDVTYNVYTDPQGMGRPWELDLIPLLIESEEWSRIEAGLIQRAELLNLLLEDLYGPRTVIKKGILPPELIYAYPGFLRPCDNILRADHRYLHMYAADLGRMSNGEICVIADRAQAPSGAGYALENRIVLSRVLPSLFRESHVHRLAAFFRALRSTLVSLAPDQKEDPHIVFLSPGSDNETYFEHAYLANYLGYTLVEGTDLTVRDGRVWLKTLDSLQPVDVILRRVDDEYCDPLELREDSYLGVPGLLQSVRDGTVSIANPIGSGVLQNPALMAFMPKLAQHFLGHELQLENTKTWWCGDKEDLGYVTTHLERLVVKPLEPGPDQRSIFAFDLSAKKLEQLRARIIARPHMFTAQEQVGLSTAPVLTEDDKLDPRHMVIRSYLVARDESYMVMPGGLTRVSETPDKLMVSSQQGGISKDTWVLASEQEKAETLLAIPPAPITTTRSGGDVPSRVADNLFWVGRYAERAEGLMRILRVIQLHLTDSMAVSGIGETGYCLHQLLRAVTNQTKQYPGFVGEQADERLRAPEQELLAVITDKSRPGSLVQTLSSLLIAARSVRDRLSADTLRVVNDIDAEFRKLQSDSLHSLDNAYDEMDNLITSLLGLSGLVNENMTHEQGWRFLDIGKRMERALHTLVMLQTTLVPVAEEGQGNALLESVLSISDSLMTYKRNYRFGTQVHAVLDLVLHDESNPRSIGYQLIRLQKHTSHLPGDRGRAQLSAEERLVLESLTELRLADTERLADADAKTQRRDQLDSFMGQLMQQMSKLSGVITSTYFRKDEEIHQLVRTRPGARG